MKFNGATFNKAQQDQLKKKVGAELDEVYSRMLNYTGDWASGNEYHENDVVTWANDGHLYEVIKAHTSSSTIDPSNAEYYKAMTATKYIKHTYATITSNERTEIFNILGKAKNGKNILFMNGSNIFHVTRASASGVELISTNYITGSETYAEILIIKATNGAISKMNIGLKTTGVTITTSIITENVDIYEEV